MASSRHDLVTIIHIPSAGTNWDQAIPYEESAVSSCNKLDERINPNLSYPATLLYLDSIE